MTRTAPKLAPPLQTSMPRQREDVWPLRMIWRAAGPIHGRSSVESGFEPGTFQPQSHFTVTTRPPRPYNSRSSYVPNFIDLGLTVCNIEPFERFLHHVSRITQFRGISQPIKTIFIKA
ncbi:hypothetical protein AVEN_137367-1 [Araneus ventricosus]|uniref:Uncharacterized protein n=1 Tax=Araneus ventricosus TaxID=182803 RepID=A0A4Y2E083_ARAVE|nr:hypothetical protein AVEN_137367-1 [Araneus ventricosus]